jgi:hypothetical protein
LLTFARLVLLVVLVLHVGASYHVHEIFSLVTVAYTMLLNRKIIEKGIFLDILWVKFSFDYSHACKVVYINMHSPVLKSACYFFK